MPQEEIDWFMFHLFDKDPLTVRRDNLPTAAMAPLVMTVPEITATMVDDDGDVGAVPPIKRRRFSGTYWW
jgi:hypothetical protein